jgi:hypothetical protein
LKANLIRLAALGFIAFLIAAVVIANRGEGAQWWSFIHEIPYGDKLGHIGLFGTLSFLCNLAFPSRRFGRQPFLITLTTLVLLTIVSLEELSQAFIPTRSFDVLDWLADLIGIAAGQTAADLCKRLSGKTTNAPTTPS